MIKSVYKMYGMRMRKTKTISGTKTERLTNKLNLSREIFRRIQNTFSIVDKNGTTHAKSIFVLRT